MRNHTPKKPTIEEIGFGLPPMATAFSGGGCDVAGEAGGTLRIGSAGRDPLHELARQGAQQMIAQAMEEEIGDYLERYADVRDEAGHRMVVRNGHKLERHILTGVGPVAVRHPRHVRELFGPEQIDRVETHDLKACPNCGGRVRRAGLPPLVIQQAELVAQPVEIVEYQARACRCVKCGQIHYPSLPAPVELGGLVGPKLTALGGEL